MVDANCQLCIGQVFTIERGGLSVYTRTCFVGSDPSGLGLELAHRLVHEPSVRDRRFVCTMYLQICDNDNSSGFLDEGAKMAAKQEKFNLRWTAQQEQAIRQAAELKQKSVSAFILDQAYEAAQKVLHDQDRFHFSLTDQEWKEFCAALDAPPKRIPALHKLMNTPSVFEKEGG